MDYKINNAPEAKAFIERIVTLPKQPGVSLDSVLADSVAREAELRRLFAQDRKNSQLDNPHVGLVDLFDAPQDVRLTHARIIKDEDDRSAKYVFPVPDDKRRKDGEYSVVNSIEEFQKNWSIFTEGSLFQLKNWNNVIAAGGSVLACLLPLSAKDGESRRTMRKFYHTTAYPTSDIDLFLWGLTPEQAEEKISEIFDAVRDSVPWDATCVRTKHAISIHSQYPYRSVQIVLRLYHSPAEILAGFDVDAPCVAYDGSRILANPRSIVALMRQANTVDMTRRSPSYEIRLAKYASRGFEIYVPDLRRADIDPTIYERSLARITGLARLLVLEKLSKPAARVSYLESRRELRSRVRNNTIYSRRMRHKRKGDLKAEEEIAGLDMNDYDVAQLHIPYGPGWTAKRIEKLVYATDLGMNSTFNPKNKDRRLHRHVAFFGTLKECIEDLCEYCPEPLDDTERALQEEEDKQYIRGRISFIEEDPGRQSMTGSFNPIDVGEWSELAYLGPTEKLFAAIVAQKHDVVQQLIASGEVDVNRRDHVGRTALQVAIFCRSEDIAIDLVDADARMSARLADGRTSLHLAAQMNLPLLLQKMLLRSNANAEKAKEEEEAKAKASKEQKKDKMEIDNDNDEKDEDDDERASSEDDWSSEDGRVKKKEREEESENQPDTDAGIPEDNVETPDVLDINLPDWDFALTPLDYAVISGATACVKALLNGGADSKLFTKVKDYGTRNLNPLMAVLLLKDDKKAEEIIELLLRAGSTSSQAGKDLFSVFHAFVSSGRLRLVNKLLQADPTASAVINIPRVENKQMFYPLTTAIKKGYYALATLLLGYGAKVAVTPEETQKIRNMQGTQGVSYYRNPMDQPHELDYMKDVILPAECALATHNYMLKLLIPLGAQVSVFCHSFYDSGRYQDFARASLLEAVIQQIKLLEKEKKKLEEEEKKEYKAPDLHSIKSFSELRTAIQNIVKNLNEERMQQCSEEFLRKKDAERSEKLRKIGLALAYYEEMLPILKDVNAKTYQELVADHPNAPEPRKEKENLEEDVESTSDVQYETFGIYNWDNGQVLPQVREQYDALFDACWTGNNARIKDICMPKKEDKSGKPPIQITAMSKASGKNRWGFEGVYNPFALAIMARKWDTARLVLNIASSQYKPKDEGVAVADYSTSLLLGADSDSDSDDDSDAYDDEDMQVDENRPETITDVVDRVPGVQCEISPMRLINASVSPRVSRDGKSVIDSNPILKQVCRDGDLEAFVNICDMIAQLPVVASDKEKRELDESYLASIISSDCPEILDEYIRRTGFGIDLRQVVEVEDISKDKEDQPKEKTSALYLGLTVHGKKRKDLARRDDHASRNSYREDLPTLWLVIQSNASKIVEYLYGPGPLAAYRYFAATKNTDRAEGLRRISDLQSQLPRLLGVLPNDRRESPLTAVILLNYDEKRISVAKRILELSPVPNLIRLPLAFTGWTPLHLAAARNLPTTFFDFLLSNGASAEEEDSMGMNIYHITCRLGQTDLLKYFMKKLPIDVTSNMLSQPIRKFGDTPFMLAIRSGKVAIVEELLNSGLDSVKQSLEMRNSKGLLPIHVAVHSGYARIAELIIKASPESEALYSENSVGETPLESACTKWFASVTRNGTIYSCNVADYILNLQGARFEPGPLDAINLQKQLDLMKETSEELKQSGKLSANTKLREVLDDFVIYLSQKKDGMQEVPQIAKSLDEFDRANYDKLLEVLVNAIRPEKRSLIHLTDVQRSVTLSLNKAISSLDNQDESDYGRNRKFSKISELPDEIDAERQKKRDQWKGILGRCHSLTQNLSEYHM